MMNEELRMAGIMRHIVIMGLLLVCSLQLKAQIDPTLAGMVYLYTEKAEDQLKAHERAMLMQTTGHIWTREEVEGTTDMEVQRLPRFFPRHHQLCGTDIRLLPRGR